MVISTKSLFLGVYASSALIRSLFLPVCYIFLLSPFALLSVRYASKEGKLPGLATADYDIKSLGLQAAFAITWACIVTRFLSNRGNDAKVDGKRRVPVLPYWVPGLRHWSKVTFGGQGWLEGVRYVRERFSFYEANATNTS